MQINDLILLLLLIGEYKQISGETRKCAPLTISKNVDLRCFAGAKAVDIALNDCRGSQPSGTVVEYKCKPLYIPLEYDLHTTESWNKLVCDERGDWLGLKSYKGFRCKEDCGRPSPTIKPLVLNGVESNSTLWPWHGTLFFYYNNVWTYICGGTLIRNQVLLTAAHCLILDRKTSPRPEDFRVVLGTITSTYVDNQLSTSTQIHTVSKIYISENYDPSKGFQADIAVLHLKDNVEFTQNIFPVCLPNDYATDVNALKKGVKGKVAGFGIREDGVLSETLHSVDLDVRSSSECFNSLKRVLTESQFCAGGSDGGKWQTLCNGDSGGGMCFLSNVHQKYYIHGITSSGDADKSKGLCQNYAVFTRIYSFIFWIRDVVEEISGEIARDLREHVPYPYDLSGTEIETVTFHALPREWENRITSFSLSYAQVDADSILNSLEFAKSLVTFNLSHVSLEGKFLRRIFLPHLSSFHLDLLEEGWSLNEKKQLPSEVNEVYVKSLLFFGKDFGGLSNWNLTSLLTLQMDIELILSIFKVLHLNFSKGEIFINGLSFCEKILHGLLQPTSEFILRNLAIRQCTITSFQHFSRSNEMLAVTTLTLDDVTIETESLNKLLQKMTKLKVLKLNPSSSETKILLELRNLPRSLTFLAVGKNVRLDLLNDDMTFSYLVFIYCDYCTDVKEFLMKTYKIFPNLKGVMIRSEVNINTSPFLINRNTFVYFEKKDDKWSKKEIFGTQLKHALYTSSGGRYFWTSEVEFFAKMRLKSFEKSAISTHAYFFRGNGRKRNFFGIPAPVQKELKSISLESTQLSSDILLTSTSSAPMLESVRLENVQLQDKLRSVNFKLESVEVGKRKFDYINEFVDGKLESIIIPFQNNRKLLTQPSNVLHKFFLQFNSVVFRNGNTTFMLFDPILGETKKSVEEILELISQLYTSHPLKKAESVIRAFYNSYLTLTEYFPQEFKQRGLIIVDDQIFSEVAANPFSKNFGKSGFLRQQASRFLQVVQPFMTGLDDRKKSQATSLPTPQALALGLVQQKLNTRTLN